MARGRMRRGQSFAPRSGRRTHAATTLQRRWRANKARKFTRKPTRLPPGVKVRLDNTEKKIVTLSPQSTDLRVLAGSAANGPKNSLVLLPQGFNAASQALTQGLTIGNYIGSWITPQYGINHKIELSFDGLVPTHADSKQGFNVEVYVCRVKISAAKAGIGESHNFAVFAQQCLDICQSELYESSFDADKLTYREMNRNVQVVAHWRVNTSQDKKLAIQAGDYMAAPPKNYSISHKTPVPGSKQRLTGSSDATPVGMLLDCHIPCVLLMCNELTANTGVINVRHASRMYFIDA